MIYAHFILDKQDRKGQLKMELPRFICECESKSYSTPEIRLYSPPDDIVHVIPDHLNEDWNYLVYHMSWPENQGILFFYISKTLQMIRISFMASLLNAVL